MNCVSLVCTVHDQTGLATVSRLCAILERIRPEVIFLEVSPADVRDFYEVRSRANLESMAVSQQRESHQIELVPVDLAPPDELFFTNFQEVCRRVAQRSSEFHRLMDWNSVRTRGDGFAYLNSEDCSALWLDVYREMRSTLERIGDSELVKMFESWINVKELREKEWIENIMKYCREHTFDRSALLVGAAHRQRIIEIAREQSAVDSTRIQWDFAGCVSPRTRQGGA